MTEDIKEQIIDNLREVYDPEIPINVYDLGLIYDISVLEDNRVHILMTLTSPTCPTVEYIKSMIQEAAEKVAGVLSVEVEITFDPPWTPDRVSQEAKEELGLVDAPSSSTSNAEFENTFSNNNVIGGEVISTVNEPIKEKICFNCSATQDQFPIFETFYKGEKTYICSKCIVKFS